MKRSILILMTCVVVTAPIRGGDDEIAKRAIAYVQRLRTKDGGFLVQLPKPGATTPSLRATTSALRVVRYYGGEIKDKDACAKFVASCYDPATGAFSDSPGGKPGVFETAVGLMAIVELKMPMEKYADGATRYLAENAKSFEDIRIAAAGFEAIKKKPATHDKWLEEVRKLANADGSFGKGPGMARDTGGSVVTILRLGGKAADPDACLKILNAGQRATGGWGKAGDTTASDLETTYRVMRCYHMLKARPANVAGLRDFIARCRNADGGYGVAPGQPSNVSGTYFASIILHWLKEK
ncbi:MAG TPA: prenyltransferase/squalene oxidase repeat-containing protein [Gemmataceae bacterium]|nr:prenyltransferase/squalene oxidase repeat-containing protein [Gemmataceae bacterium]